ncbi:MAG: NAD(+)/NADH kinase [Actinomycetota bacterium]
MIGSVVLVPHRERPSARETARAAAAWLADAWIEVRMPEAEASACGLPALGRSVPGLTDGAGLVVSIGGDGTMLSTVQLIYPAPVPVIGVNAGHLGYLSELEPAGLIGALPRLAAGDFTVSERMMIAVEVTPRGGPATTHYALNEAVLERPRAGHTVRLDVTINRSPFTSYAADGVIVATPTGTTAYSFSARGPIASPAMRCLVLTPLSPHMLFDRSLLLSDRESIELVVDGEAGAGLTVDGRDLGILGPGDRVACTAAPDPVRLATLAPRDFHQILKAKFALPDR